MITTINIFKKHKQTKARIIASLENLNHSLKNQGKNAFKI